MTTTQNHILMRRTFVMFAVALSALPVAARAQSDAATKSASRSLEIRHVNIVDVERGVILTNRRVVTRDGRITEVRLEARTLRLPASDTVVDGTGKFLMPGLWDMHIHSNYPGFPAVMGPQYTVNGVTGVREMFGDLATAKVWRSHAVSADTVWPRIVASGHIVDGKPPIWPQSVVAVTEADGRRAVDSLKAAGADFIKVYSLLPRAAYLGVAARAKEVGIPYAGHVSYAMTVAEASDAGQKSIEHMDGIIRACSSRDDELRPAVRAAVENGWGFDSITALGRTQNEALLASQDDTRCRTLAARLRANGTWLSPTLTVLRGIAWADDTTQQADPRLAYMPKFVTFSWAPKNDFRLKNITPEGWARRKREFLRNRQLVGLMHKAGVPIIAGTDVLNPWIFPGWSLHDELAHYVDAGLTPAEALRTATVNPARYLGLADSTGTVTRGKWADLVLLDANPLADIRNTTKIHAVVANGRLVTAERRDAMLTEVKRLLAPPARR